MMKGLPKKESLQFFELLLKTEATSYLLILLTHSIQIEFADNKKIIDAWKTLSESRNAAVPPPNDQEGWARKIAEWNSKTDKLLYEMATVLGIKVNPFDIQASYVPVAWGNEQQSFHSL